MNLSNACACIGPIGRCPCMMNDRGTYGITTPELLASLKAAAKHVMTSDEIFEQRVSWVWGQLMDTGDTRTRDEIRASLKAIG